MVMLPPIPYNVPLLDGRGLVSRNWQQFFEQLLRRVGGTGDLASLDNVVLDPISSDMTLEPVAQLAAMRQRLDDLETFDAFEL